MTYEYKCLDSECNHITEIKQKITAYIYPNVPCEKCDGLAKLQISGGTGFKLVGEGWPSADMKKGIWND